MRVGVVSAVLCGLLMSFVPAQAMPADLLVVARDARADVQITRSAGPGAAVRRSIDLRRVRVQAGRGRVRFEVKIKRVWGQRDFDQMIFVRLRPPADSEETWTSDLGFSAQTRRLGYAGYSCGCRVW